MSFDIYLSSKISIQDLNIENDTKQEVKNIKIILSHDNYNNYTIKNSTLEYETMNKHLIKKLFFKISQKIIFILVKNFNFCHEGNKVIYNFLNKIPFKLKQLHTGFCDIKVENFLPN